MEELLAQVLRIFFLKLFGSIGSYIILLFIILISAILFTEISLKDIFRKNKIKIKGKEKKKRIKKTN